MITLSEPVMKLPDQRPLLFSHNGSVADRPDECNYWIGASASTPFMYSLMNLLSVEKPVRTNSWLIRMHSSGMRTARLLTVSQHALRRGVCLWSLGGGLWSWGGGGCLPRRGVCWGVHPSMQWCRQPPVDRQTPVKT